MASKETTPSDKVPVKVPDKVLTVVIPDCGLTSVEEPSDLKKNAVTQVRPRSRSRYRFHSLDSSLSRTSRSLRPAKERRHDSETRYSVDYEVRFTLPDLKAYIDRIRNSYSPDPYECPAIKERLERHRHKYHPDKNKSPQVSVRNIAVGPSFMEIAKHNKSTIFRNQKFSRHSGFISADKLRHKSLLPKRSQCTDPFGLNNRYSSINKSLKSPVHCKRRCKVANGCQMNPNHDYYHDNQGTNPVYNQEDNAGTNYESKSTEIDINNKRNSSYNAKATGYNTVPNSANNTGTDRMNDICCNNENGNIDDSDKRNDNNDIKNEMTEGNRNMNDIENNLRRNLNNDVKNEKNDNSDRNSFNNNINNNGSSRNINDSDKKINIKNENRRSFNNDRNSFDKNINYNNTKNGSNNNDQFHNNNKVGGSNRYMNSYNNGVNDRNRFSNNYNGNGMNNYNNGINNNGRNFNNICCDNKLNTSGMYSNDCCLNNYNNDNASNINDGTQFKHNGNDNNWNLNQNNGTRIDFHDGLRNINDGVNSNNPCLVINNDLGINTKCSMNPCSNFINTKSVATSRKKYYTSNDNECVRSNENNTKKCCIKTAMTLPSEICHDEKNPNCPIKVCSNSYRYNSPTNKTNKYGSQIHNTNNYGIGFNQSLSRRTAPNNCKRDVAECPQCDTSSKTSNPSSYKIIVTSAKGESSVYKPIQIKPSDCPTDTIAIVCPNPKPCYNTPNVYETYLHEEVNNWLKKVPFHPNNNHCARVDRQNIINDMVDRLKSLVEKVDDDNYIELVKTEINKCIDNLHIWYPGAKRDQPGWRARICDSLLNSIRDINKLLIRDKKCGDIQEYLKQFCTDKFTSVEKKLEGIGCSNCIDICDGDLCKRGESGPCKKPCKSCKVELEKEIQIWMTQSNILQPFDVISKKDLKTLLANKVSPYLFKTYHPINKLQIKSQIVDTIQSLPICINCMSNHKINTMKYANDLTDRLLLFQTKLEQKCNYSVCLEPRDREDTDFLDNIPYSGPRINCDEVPKVKKKEFAVGNDLNDFLVEEIKFSLENTALESDRCVEKSTLNILLSNVEEIKDGNDNRAKVELFYLYQNTGKLTIAETLNLVKNIMRTVKEVLHLKISQNNKIDKIQNPFMVFTCHERISFYNKMPITVLSLTNSMSQLSKDEENYLNNVAAMIKEWLVSIDNDAINLASERKTILANELANNILKQTQLEHMKTNISLSDKQKIWRVFIYKWLIKHNLYDDLNAANVKVSVLISRLKDIKISRTHNQMKRLFSKNYLNILGPDIFGTNFTHNTLSKKVSYIRDRKTSKLKNEVNNYLKKEIENTGSNIEGMNKYLSDALDKIEKVKFRSSFQILTLESQTKSDSALNEKRSKRSMRSQTDPSEDVKGVILTYIDHNDAIDDLVARNTAVLILVRKLQKLSKKFITDLFERENFNFSIPVLEQELRYIAVISDWLKLMTILCNFNEEGSKERISFVNSLASKIYKVEASRAFIPDDSNHYNVLVNVIIDSLSVLPLPPEDLPNIPQRADKLATLVLNLNNVPLRYNRQTQASITPEQNLCEFLEDYLRFRRNDLYDDHLKLDALAKRIIDELKLIEGSQSPEDAQLDNFFMTYPVKRIETELHYSTEISEWLKNLPVPENCMETKVKMISDLAERIYLRDMKKSAKDTNAGKDLNNYLDNWINSLPLEGNVDIPVATQQLKRRIDSIKQKHKRSKSLPPSESGNKWYHKILLCRKKNKSHAKQDHIVDVIEDECNNLSLKGDKPTVKKLKLELANNLFQSVSQLNANPVIFNNDNLYKNTLSDEIDNQLNNIPAKNISQGEKKKFKNDVLNGIMVAKSVNKDVNAGHFYEQRLEQTIETSMPHPVKDPLGDDPGFEIYKHRLAEMFIADNFDHSNQAVKLKYQKQIQTEIDKYFADAQKRNAIPLTREQLQNELYSTLFRVPIPNEEAICDEVGEVKTRSEVDQWLNELPLREPTGMGELLEWDQILTALTRKVYKIEKNNPPNMDKKLYDEILKWLLKLPLLPGANVNVLVWRLIDRLKATKDERKCIRASNTTTVEPSHSKHAVSKISSDNRRQWSLPPPVNATMTEYKSIDLLIDTVENWANQIPLPANTQTDEDNNNILRDVITTNIIMKISELNSKPEIFDNCELYNNLVAQEVNNALINLPETNELIQSKNARINELTEAIMNLRPHVLEDRDKYPYKDELLCVLINTLEQPEPKNKKVKDVIDKVNENIIENFLEYKHGYRDDASRVYYKSKIEGAIIEYLQHVNTKANTEADHLIKTNRVITELSKVHPINPAAIVEDIQMNRMKNEVKAFTRPFVSKETGFVESIQNELCKSLFEKEKSGHTPETEQAMKIDIEKAMQALNKTNECNEMEIFVKRLRENEAARKLVMPRILGNSTSNRDLAPVRKPMSPTTSVFSVISFVNGSGLNSLGFSGGDPSIDQVETTNKVKLTASNQTPASFFPFDDLYSSTYPSLGHPGFEASLQETQLVPSEAATYGEGQCCQPVVPPCCQPALPPCCENQELGVQVNQPDTSTQYTSTEWLSMQQGTYIENLPGFQDLSLSQPNDSFLPDSNQLSYSGFAGAGPPCSSPISGVPQQCQTDWQYLQAQNLPGYQNQSFNESTFDQGVSPWDISLPPPAHLVPRQAAAVYQNPQPMIQGGLTYPGFAEGVQVGSMPQLGVQQIMVNAPNYAEWQDPGFAATPGQSSNPSGNYSNNTTLPVCCDPLSYPGFVGGVPVVSIPIQTEPYLNSFQSSFAPYSGYAAGGMNASSPLRQDTPISYSGFAGGVPAASSPIQTAPQNRQDNTLPYSVFAGGVPVTSTPIRQDNPISYSRVAGGSLVASSPIQYVQPPPNGTQWLSQEQGGTQGRQDTQISYSGFAGGGQVASSPINPAQNLSQLQNQVVSQRPMCCRERSRTRVQTSPLPPNAEGSHWLTLEDGSVIQMQRSRTQMQVSPTQMQGSTLQRQGSTFTSPISQDTTFSYTGFAGGAQITSSPISQFQNQVSPDCCVPQRPTCCKERSQRQSVQTQPNIDIQMQGSSIPMQTRQNTPISYSGFAGGSHAQYSPQFQTTGGPIPPPIQSYQPQDGTQWLTLQENTPAQYLPNFQNASSSQPSQRIVSFANNTDPNQTQLSCSEFLGAIPAASSPVFSRQINPQMDVVTGGNSEPQWLSRPPSQSNQISNQVPCCTEGCPSVQTPFNGDGTQWLTLEQGTPVQMQGPPMQIQRPPMQMQGPPMQGPLQIQSTPIQMQGPPMQMQGPPVQMQGLPIQGPSTSLPTKQNTVPYSGFAGGSQHASLPLSPEQYSQMHSNQSNEVTPNCCVPQVPQCCRDKNRGTVLPWNTQSSLGSVQQPSQQAVAMIHSPPENSNKPTCCRYKTCQNTPEKSMQMPRIVVSPLHSTAMYSPSFQGVSPDLGGQYLSPYQNQMPNFDPKASMPNQCVSFQNQPSFNGTAMPQLGNRQTARVSFAQQGAGVPNISAPSESYAEHKMLLEKSVGKTANSDCDVTDDGVCDPCPYTDSSAPCKANKRRENSNNEGLRDMYDSEICLCRRRRRMPMLQYCDSIDDFIPMPMMPMSMYYPRPFQYPMF